VFVHAPTQYDVFVYTPIQYDVFVHEKQQSMMCLYTHEHSPNRHLNGSKYKGVYVAHLNIHTYTHINIHLRIPLRIVLAVTVNQLQDSTH